MEMFCQRLCNSKRVNDIIMLGFGGKHNVLSNY